MKTLRYEHNGQTYHLCLNGAALFDVYEKFGTKGFVTDHIQGSDRKAFDATCWMLAKLAEQGEMVRRYQGHDHGKFPAEQMFRATLRPVDVVSARQAIGAAVALGFRREVEDEEDEVDLGLLELQKKNESDLTRAQYLRAGTQLLQLSAQETLLLNIGTLSDLLVLEQARRNPQREE